MYPHLPQNKPIIIQKKILCSTKVFKTATTGKFQFKCVKIMLSTNHIQNMTTKQSTSITTRKVPHPTNKKEYSLQNNPNLP